MRYIASISFLVVLFLPLMSVGQKSIHSTYINNQRIDLSDQQLKSSDFFAAQSKRLGLNDNDDMRLLRSWSDLTGVDRERYKQYHKGLPVIGGTYTLHSNDENVEYATGNIFPYIKIDENITLSKSETIEAAIQQTKLELEKESIIEPAEGILWDHIYKGLCVIDSNYPEVSGDYRVAHSYIVYSEDYSIPIRYQIYVDAHSGQLLCKLNEIKCGSVKGIAKTRYYGDQEITTDSVAPDLYYLRDMTRGDGIVTLDFESGRDTFTDTDNIWAPSPDDNTAYEKAVAGDAHYCTTEYYDMMQDYFSWDGLDGEGGELVSVVNVFGKYYVNAFWNGSATHYGNGDCDRYGPLTTMTVVGHEFAHGWTDYTSDLIYRNESGALNESISDIMGKALEYYADTENFTWYIGDLIRKDESVRPFRSMSNPNERNHPKYYGGNSWRTGTADAGGVHSNSGVLNYWFYLLVEGGIGVNEEGEAFDVSALGMRKALDIVFITQTAYLTESSNYFDFFYSSQQAVEDLYGENAVEMNSVLEAWRAVGLYDGIDNFDLSIDVAEEYIAICTGEETHITAVIRNAGRRTIEANTPVDLTFLQNLSVKVTESYILPNDLLPGEFISYSFDAPVILDSSKDGAYTVSVIGDDINKLNNSASAEIFISEVGGLDLSLMSFELYPGLECSNELSRYRMSIRSLGCEEVPELEYFNLEVESDKGNFTIVNRLFTHFYAGDLYGVTGFLSSDIPQGITEYSVTLVYGDDNSVLNNSLNDLTLDYTESIGVGYRRDFEEELDTEKFIVEEDPNYHLHSVVNYKGNNVLALRSKDNSLSLRECDETEDFFNNYTRTFNIKFCVDAMDVDDPVFSFDLLKLVNDNREVDLPDNLFGTMLQVTIEDEEYPIIYAQEDDKLLLHEIDLPNDYVGPLEIEVLVIYSDNDDDIIRSGDSDVVMFDNFRLYDRTDINPDFDKFGYSVAPNPVGDMLRVESSSSQFPYDVYVFDRIGRLVGQSNDNQNIAMINMENLEQGVYFITIIFSGNILSSHKVIKM
jgi:Zn-dependent metalloprotease